MCAGLALFGVAVGIGNIVVGTDTDDVHHTRWHIAGGSLYPGILVSVSPRHPLMYLCIPFLLRRLGCLKLIIRSALSFNLFKITPFKIRSRRSSHKRIYNDNIRQGAIEDLILFKLPYKLRDDNFGHKLLVHVYSKENTQTVIPLLFTPLQC